ncbi:GGDEF domain-containing protein [Ruminococcus albus]|uniref:Diguanylate cyclase (GGDEF) domain-containing protein n=1 Tax=Ruminococcus albus TaxID=1264 RepID=A0A1I1KB82_RUMAL|nr:GGDEF domain-containing protein [Ruminococcus albus]SFC58137.1 diguanylate cyclase (GGDEF) domain-containing protein [Ruminococcus albus]
MSEKNVMKLTYGVNTALLFIVFGLMLFFQKLEADFLVYFSIPTLLVYIFNYLLVYKNKLEIFVWLVYFWIILYMGVTTICLGESYGFHLYCFSMIPVIYASDYVSFRINGKNLRSLPISIGVAVFYFVFMGYVRVNGPVYDRGGKYSMFFLVFNSLVVFWFLVLYLNASVRSIIVSETKLTDMAHKDRLTNLYNRHYMLDRLEEVSDEKESAVLAMADIDDFKKINDQYGHNAGDEVLKAVAEKMTSVCEGCDIARWGGEEFLILFCESDGVEDILEKMRADIASSPVEFEGQVINITVTVGMAGGRKDQSIDEWIQDVDNKLYIGKNSGKNRVIR